MDLETDNSCNNKVKNLALISTKILKKEEMIDAGRI